MENEKIVAFEAPFGGLGATYAVHLRLIGKLVDDFLLVMIELFFARCFRFVTMHAFDRQTDGQTDRQMLITIPRLRSCSAVKIIVLTHDLQKSWSLFAVTRRAANMNQPIENQPTFNTYN